MDGFLGVLFSQQNENLFHLEFVSSKRAGGEGFSIGTHLDMSQSWTDSRQFILISPSQVVHRVKICFTWVTQVRNLLTASGFWPK
jgi:hypothetical protein